MTFDARALEGRQARLLVSCGPDLQAGTLGCITAAIGDTPDSCTIAFRARPDGLPLAEGLPLATRLSFVAVNDTPEPLPLGRQEWVRRRTVAGEGR